MKKVFLIANILISTNTFAQTNGWIDPRHHDLDKSMTNNKEKQGKNKHIKK